MTPEELAVTPGPDEELGTIHDVARYLRVSRSWLYAKVAAEEIPHLHVLGRLRFHMPTLRAWALGARQPTGTVLPFKRNDT